MAVVLGVVGMSHHEKRHLEIELRRLRWRRLQRIASRLQERQGHVDSPGWYARWTATANAHDAEHRAFQELQAAYER